MSLALRLGQFSAGVAQHEVTLSTRLKSAGALLDTLAVTVAGRNEAASHLALSYLAEMNGMGDGRGGASLWGRTEKLSVEHAALWNGISGHVLDYDDVTPPLSGHPSVAMFPALVALAESFALPVSRLHTAYVVGLECIVRLATALNPAHYRKGWHSTASIGSIGCTVACSKLLDLSAGKTAHAIGLAVAQAAGTRMNFGSHAKSFQAGNANAIGVRSALLARQGFESGPDSLDVQGGYAGLYGDGVDLDTAFADIGRTRWAIDEVGLDVKKYPLCYGTHRTLDGLFDMMAKHGFQMRDIEQVHVHTSYGQLTPLIHSRPKTGLEAKFSMQYAVAAAVLDGRVRLASFTDEAVQRPAIQAFFDRIRVDCAAESEDHARWSEVTVHLLDGLRHATRVTELRGSSQHPLRADELRGKVQDCLDWGRIRADASVLSECILSPDERSVTELMAAVNELINIKDAV